MNKLHTQSLRTFPKLDLQYHRLSGAIVPITPFCISENIPFTSKNTLLPEHYITSGFTRIPDPETSNNLFTMTCWGNITSTCARWFSFNRFLEYSLLVCSIAEILTFASLSIYFYCLTGYDDPSSRLSVCHYNYAARIPLTKWTTCISLLARAISSATGLWVLVARMQSARHTTETLILEGRSIIDPVQFLADLLFAKAEIDHSASENEAMVARNESLVEEQNAVVVEQDAVVSDLAKWVMKVSDLVAPLSDCMATKENKQSLPLETVQQQALVGELAGLASKLSALASKQVDFEETKKKGQEEKDRLRIKTLQEHLGAEREKITSEKAKLQEERENLEAEKEALKARAKKLGIEEEKLRTTTPKEFQKLVDAQEKLYDDLERLRDEIQTRGNTESPEETASLTRDFRVKIRETLISMNANDKLIEEAFEVLDSMGSITPDIKESADWSWYWMKAVAGLFVDHIMEDEQVNEGTQGGGIAQEQPQVQEVLLDEAKSQEKEVLQVGDGLQ
ncbi:hypothetical protein V496_09857 [Pseudogymnoascus sp. VKM F-4515 (FW-2607)]|nr:hypothetical protein V496_09857 [Pseudogymnoascus sp. VKM F-4515 (FW-2607)]